MTSRPVLAQKAASLFAEHYGYHPTITAWGPGRVNLIGGHTDYNEGLAMPTAINRWVAVAIRPRTDQTIRVQSTDFDSMLTIESNAPTGSSISWHRYIEGAIKTFSDHAGFPGGFDALFLGDVPSGAGLSSSAALLVAWMNGLRALTGATFDDWELVKLCQSVEHRFLGVQCGLLDQVASQFSRAQQVMEVDFRDLSISYVSAPMDDYVWIAVHSGKSRELATSAYQQRVRECKKGLETLRETHSQVEHQRDITLDMLTSEESWNRRLRHVVSENQRVRSLAEALSAGSFDQVGALLTQAHQSLRNDYEVSCDELDTLIELGHDSPGWLGGRMMGGGFGGCVLNLVACDQAEAFKSHVMSRYQEKFPQHNARVFSFLVAGGAGVYA